MLAGDATLARAANRMAASWAPTSDKVTSSCITSDSVIPARTSASLLDAQTRLASALTTMSADTGRSVINLTGTPARRHTSSGRSTHASSPCSEVVRHSSRRVSVNRSNTQRVASTPPPSRGPPQPAESPPRLVRDAYVSH
jgi:hypothetical protein